MAWTVTMLVERDGVARHVCRASAPHDVAPDAAVVRAVASMMVERLNEDRSGEALPPPGWGLLPLKSVDASVLVPLSDG